MTSDTPECRCLNCGKRLNASTGANTTEAPRPGDLALCFRCGAVMMVADDLTLRGMSEEEMDRLCASPKTMDYIARQVRGIQLMPKMN